MDKLDTRTFLVGPTKGKEINLEIEPGKKLDVTCLTVSDELTKMGERELQFLMNGQLRLVVLSVMRACWRTAFDT